MVIVHTHLAIVRSAMMVIVHTQLAIVRSAMMVIAPTHMAIAPTVTMVGQPRVTETVCMVMMDHQQHDMATAFTLLATN